MRLNTIQQLAEEIFEKDPEYSVAFSVFEKWLSIEECQERLMCVAEVDTFEKWEKIKSRERQYIALLLELNFSYGIIFVNSEYEELQENIAFNDIFLLCSKHIMQDQKMLFYLKKQSVFILLKYDFTILIYGGVTDENFYRILKTCGFHQLPLLQ